MGSMLIYSCLENDIREYKWLILLIIGFIGMGIFPLAKFAVESFFLTFTTREFWHRGLFMDTPAKHGGVALFHLFCFIFSIPLSMIYLALYFIKNRITH